MCDAAVIKKINKFSVSAFPFSSLQILYIFVCIFWFSEIPNEKMWLRKKKYKKNIYFFDILHLTNVNYQLRMRHQNIYPASKFTKGKKM